VVSEPLTRRGLALGVILGVSVGLFMDSVLAVLLRAPLVFLIVFSLGLVVDVVYSSNGLIGY
jgi:hypothetical protein